MTEGASTATVWNNFHWGAAPWGGTMPTAAPTFVDYITVDGQIVAQHTIQYPSASAWGRAVWGAFSWGLPPGSIWGSSAPANPPRFTWGTDPWSGPVEAWNYFNLDHLGSVAVITDQGGNVVQRLSYDAWGRQRNPNGTDVACGAIASLTTRGFTNQEQLPSAVMCGVNLNARLYDPAIGKFMAADTIVPEPFSGQSFNRYSYVANNPLSFTDVTGHDLGSFLCGLSSYCSPIIYYVPGGGTTTSPSDANNTAAIIPGSAPHISQNLSNRSQQDQFQAGVAGSGAAIVVGSAGGYANCGPGCEGIVVHPVVLTLPSLPADYLEFANSIGIGFPGGQSTPVPPRPTPRPTSVATGTNRNVCPAGPYTQFNLSGGLNLSFISPGFSLSVGATVSVPPWSLSSGILRPGWQVSGSAQLTGTLGLGAYAGLGLSGGATTSTGPLAVGTSTSSDRYFEAEGGWGEGAGVSATFPASGGSSGSYSLPKMGPGAGFGAYGGYGRALTGSFTSPPLGCH